jgi:hypothetical protein
MMRHLVKVGHKKKADPRPEELDRAGKVFILAGGSWERLFKGSVRDMTLLKKTIKVAVEKGVFTSPAKWG